MRCGRYDGVDCYGGISTFNVINRNNQPSYTKLQSYTVPEDGLYILEVVGGQGGSASNDSHQGGKGALLRGRVQLKKGDNLQIAVGEKGIKGSGDGNNPSGGGGGGASSIVKVNGDLGSFSSSSFSSSSNELLLIAGGGGGGASQADGSGKSAVLFHYVNCL